MQSPSAEAEAVAREPRNVYLGIKIVHVFDNFFYFQKIWKMKMCFCKSMQIHLLKSVHSHQSVITVNLRNQL